MGGRRAICGVSRGGGAASGRCIRREAATRMLFVGRGTRGPTGAKRGNREARDYGKDAGCKGRAAI